MLLEYIKLLWKQKEIQVIILLLILCWLLYTDSGLYVLESIIEFITLRIGKII